MSSKLVLVLNCGSSSLKFAVVNAVNGENLISGLAECFNLADARIKWTTHGKKDSTNLPPMSAHSEAVAYIVEHIIKKEGSLASQFVAIGHRIVHGGEKFTHSVLVDENVINNIEECISLAPLHNPAHVLGIRAAQAAFPELPQVVVFDTAFHQSMPAKAFMYALPYALYKDKGIRRYGMHGTSHLFITQEAAIALDKPISELNIISAHLGNGASVTAIKNGQCVDTSMGMTPLAGLVMGTRCGDLDPSIIEHLIAHEGYTIEQIMDILQKESGLLGISGISSDFRTITEEHLKNNPRATLALDMFTYRLAKYIASYAVPLGRIDAIVFTGGIGENSALVRQKVLELLSIFSYHVDVQKNETTILGKSGIISTPDSPIAMVIPTNEEWVIAKDAVALVEQSAPVCA
ncbi:acetate kinase A/propionate kinase 2 [Psychromonas sp. CNPT3]|uniref:acetate kinase n=1 Tax=Psychromonas sp. CNPT3 TaxID=314282 RepID=UPI00006E763D|nr:acetate kinase [Psychromonas sp. CNPT3]AGH80335.1 acetate kinase A/propionate kinase 2 [Psychromonas sp. CNPT3]